MKTDLKIVRTIVKILFAVAAALFVVYFWNLDQKLMDWAYAQECRFRDRRRADGEL
jgi:uncharacterized membrane protein